MAKWFAALALLGLGAVAVREFWFVERAAPGPSRGPVVVRGLVVGPQGPLSGAAVGVRAQRLRVKTDERGEFCLPVATRETLRIVASAKGHLIAGADWSGQANVTITLRPHPTVDSPEYAWIDPRPQAGDGGRCAACHGEIYREWSQSGHAAAANNPRFLNVYDGSDWDGERTVGWNLLAEYPEGAGVCYACHAPSVEPSATANTDIRQVDGVPGLGVHCDFCHKVADVTTQRVGYNHGRFAMRLIRPADGRRLFFGPLDDVDRGEDVSAPLYRESRYCASCHEGVLFGTHAYSTYSEWLASDYAERGVHCQQCHMAPTGA